MTSNKSFNFYSVAIECKVYDTCEYLYVLQLLFKVQCIWLKHQIYKHCLGQKIYMNHFSSCWVVVSLSRESRITLQCSRITVVWFKYFIPNTKTYRKVLQYMYMRVDLLRWGGRVTACTTTSCSFLRKVLLSSRHSRLSYNSQSRPLRELYWWAITVFKIYRFIFNDSR